VLYICSWQRYSIEVGYLQGLENTSSRLNLKPIRFVPTETPFGIIFYDSKLCIGELVTLLLEEYTANPGPKDNSGRTPLSYAAGKGHLEIVEFSLKDMEPARTQCVDMAAYPCHLPLRINMRRYWHWHYL
jgi:hypothetical protein